MSHVRKGILITAPQWAKHLRPYWRRLFWKQHRQAEQREAEPVRWCDGVPEKHREDVARALEGQW